MSAFICAYIYKTIMKEILEVELMFEKKKNIYDCFIFFFLLLCDVTQWCKFYTMKTTDLKCEDIEANKLQNTRTVFS